MAVMRLLHSITGSLNGLPGRLGVIPSRLGALASRLRRLTGSLRLLVSVRHRADLTADALRRAALLTLSKGADLAADAAIAGRRRG